MNFRTRIRDRQVRAISRILLAAERLPLAAPLLDRLGRNEILARALVGHRRAFRTRETAECSIMCFDSLGHADPASIDLHITFSQRARPSDYPVLLHLGNLLPELGRIVDIGGSTGNLFYCYCRYLAFPAGFQWIVHDLPTSLEAGRKLAESAGETRIQFADTINACESADLAIFSGSLHYFEELPPMLLRNWKSRPKYVIVNRSPMGGSPETYAIQDAGSLKLTARIIDRASLLRCMEEHGYELVDEWPVYELALRVPLSPYASAPTYTGCFFRLSGGTV